MFSIPDNLMGLSGANILLCFILVFLSSSNWSKEFFLFLIIATGGFLLEGIGVNTGLLFGNYEYGQELGYKLLGVPIVLGFNWYCVVAASAHLVTKVLKNKSLTERALWTGLLCTFLDYLIEPVAMHFDFWDWQNGIIPLYNYISWFIISTVFGVIYLYNVKDFNRTAMLLFFTWVIFFFILNFV